MARKRTHIISSDKEKVEELTKTVTDVREKERLIAAGMAMSGEHTLELIADAVGRSRSTVQRWLDKFIAGGVGELLNRGKAPGNPPALDAEVRAEVSAKLREGEWRTARRFRRWLAETHGIELKEGGAYYWLGKLEGSLKVPRPCHRKQDPAAREEFRTTGWSEALGNLEIPVGASVRFWVMDESRFGLHTIVRRCWGLRGVRIVKPFQLKFTWDYVYGAIDVLSGEPFFRFLPTVSGEATRLFLRELVATDPEAHHVVLWDGAGFHQSPGECEGLENVHPIRLPPYCPELNPIEKLWDSLKDEVCNQVFDTIEELRGALEEIFKEWREDHAKGRGLIGTNWLIQGISNFLQLNPPIFN